ncbi:preprotein translocase subunit SecY [Candidatus Micrarchaeota archaeon]|nr:preprotein translocase subunit SecY [Candidatus Micrarchaeota archaeon]MBD3418291.1 preprotein translocase subunit SecY [Candidatus Micrarchaeota archaeon]
MGAILEFGHRIAKMLPEIKPPVRPPDTKERFMWTGVALFLFFLMYNVVAFGAKDVGGQFDFLQMITASNFGSLLTTSIGPIVLASIFLQLFSGAGIIDLDPKNPKEKAKFQELQKVLAIVIALVEATIFVMTGRVLLADGLDPSLAMPLVIFQIALGSVIVLYLDEVVTKYGIGSGISLFIAAGVSFSIIGGTIGLIFGETGVLGVIAGGGAEAIPGALIVLAPILVTAVVWYAVSYGEGMKVEIPLAYQRARGLSPKLPLNLFYLSNIPVIFASALLMNVQLFAVGLAGVNVDIGGFNIIEALGYVDANNQLTDGLLYLITPIYGGGQNTLAHINFILNGVTPVFGIPEWVHAIVYVLFLAFVSVVFGRFWAETSNMDTKGMTDQLIQSGMQIPGWRTDRRMLEKILDKYIPPLIFLGSFLVGLLAGLADLTGALGTGTGILLTVSILYRTYQQMERQKMLENTPFLSGILGR